jgi:hypothetical protein
VVDMASCSNDDMFDFCHGFGCLSLGRTIE